MREEDLLRILSLRDELSFDGCNDGPQCLGKGDTTERYYMMTALLEFGVTWDMLEAWAQEALWCIFTDVWERQCSTHELERNNARI